MPDRCSIYIYMYEYKPDEGFQLLLLTVSRPVELLSPTMANKCMYKYKGTRKRPQHVKFNLVFVSDKFV